MELPLTVVQWFLTIVDAKVDNDVLESFICTHPQIVIYSCWEVFHQYFPRGIVSLLIVCDYHPRLFRKISQILLAQDASPQVRKNVLRIVFEGKDDNFYPIADAVRAINPEYLQTLIEVAPAKKKILDRAGKMGTTIHRALNLEDCRERVRFIVENAPSRTKLLTRTSESAPTSALHKIMSHPTDFTSLLVDWVIQDPSLLNDSCFSMSKNLMAKLLCEREKKLVEETYSTLLEQEGESVDYNFPTLVLSFVVQETALRDRIAEEKRQRNQCLQPINAALAFAILLAT